MEDKQLDITKLDIVALKSLAYDILVQIENAQNNLRFINTEIQKRNQLPENLGIKEKK